MQGGRSGGLGRCQGGGATHHETESQLRLVTLNTLVMGQAVARAAPAAARWPPLLSFAMRRSATTAPRRRRQGAAHRTLLRALWKQTQPIASATQPM